MNLPDQPPTFRQPTPAERPWWWRLEDATGAEVGVDVRGRREIFRLTPPPFVDPSVRED